MCLIIDANALAATLNSDDAKHSIFLPLIKWIAKGKGKIVYGGSQIKKEYKACYKYLRMLKYLEQNGKIVFLPDDEVDKVQEDLKSRKTHRDFDDSHLLAMVIVSEVRIVCTLELRAIPFLKDKTLYPTQIKIPKIYSKASNKSLLVDDNIANICLPCSKGNKELACVFKCE
ncbi:MAG: hypothetical protein JW915_06420 [Chitinispirillaceae bacterium]|nr:hypothetical protein [Chitinispirillaceae bacterium]